LLVENWGREIEKERERGKKMYEEWKVRCWGSINILEDM